MKFRFAPAFALATLIGAFCPSLATAQTYAIEGGEIGNGQVERGRIAYQDHCAACHGGDLKSVLGTAPDLTGSAFKYGWAGHTVGEKYAIISATMPAGTPGALSGEAYADIVAFILSFNGVEVAGEGELPPDQQALDAVSIVAR